MYSGVLFGHSVAQILDEKRNEFLRDKLINLNGADLLGVWIGAHRKTGDGEFVWPDGMYDIVMVQWLELRSLKREAGVRSPCAARILAAMSIFLSRLAMSAKTLGQGLNLHLLQACSRPV